MKDSNSKEKHFENITMNEILVEMFLRTFCSFCTFFLNHSLSH